MYIGGHGEHRTDAAPARNPETNTSPTNGTYSVAKIFYLFLNIFKTNNYHNKEMLDKDDQRINEEYKKPNPLKLTKYHFYQ